MKKWLIAILAVLGIALTGLVGYLYTQTDREGPEIAFSEKKITCIKKA